MKDVFVLVTIDTECDKGAPGWCLQKPMSFKNIPLQKELLMPLFKKYDIRPTYLLSPEVLYNEESIEILKSLENVELGTHLHEEFIEPNANFETDRTENIQIALSYEIESEKLKNLTQLFKNKIGYQPKSFRSGRFGSSKKTTKILSDLGYKVDSSVLPYTKKFYKNNLNIDFWGITTIPYFENFKNKKILEVPLTLINPQYEFLPKFIQNQVNKEKSFVKSILSKLGFKFKTKWLRPYREDGHGLIEIAEHVIHKHFKNSDKAIINIMFHSNEILVNGSPFCKNKEEVNQFILSLDQLFNHIQNNYNLCSIGLGDVYGIYAPN